MAFLLSLSPCPAKPPRNPSPDFRKSPSILPFRPTSVSNSSKREFIFKSASLFLHSLIFWPQFALSSSKSVLSGIANTSSWFQFFGDGFTIRVPPQFEDVMEPEDYNAGLSLYGDKVKPRTFAARFASPDGSEVVSVVIRPSNQLKITFLEAKDITAFGSLKQAAKIFVPAGSTLYSARTIKIKEDEGLRTYYFYEFGMDELHAALVASVDSGKVYVSGATAPQSKWEDDGVRLRSAVVSLQVL